MTSMPFISERRTTVSEAALFDVPTLPVGSKTSSSVGQDNPELKQRIRVIGKSDTRVPFWTIQRQFCREVEADVMPTNDNGSALRIAHQRIKGRKFMVNAPSGEPDSQNQRGIDMTQSLVEIGALLLTDMMQPPMWYPVSPRGSGASQNPRSQHLAPAPAPAPLPHHHRRRPAATR